MSRIRVESVPRRLLRWFRGVLGCCLLLPGLLGQPLPSRETGDPFLRIYAPQEYGAFYQGWDVVQDRRGLIYVGNNSGVLEYDGTRWRLIPTTHRTVARSLAVAPSGRIYVGAMAEIGYLARNPQGEMVFQSLMHLVGPEDRFTSDTLNTVALGETIYFQTIDRLFRLQEGRLRAWKAEGTFLGAWDVQDILYLQDSARGLLQMRGETLEPLPGCERFQRDKITSIQPWDQGKLLIATQSQGLFLFDGHLLTPLSTAADETLRSAQINHALVLGDGTLAIGTLRAGFLRLSREGAWLDQVGREQGLPGDSVKHLLQDAQGGLWMVLGKGLGRLELPSPLTRFGPQRGLIGSVVSAYRHQGTLLVGTDQGLFRLVDEGARGARFHQVEGIEGTAWDFLSMGPDLVVANQHGVIEVKGNRASTLWQSPVVVYRLHRSRQRPDLLLAGTQNGLRIFKLVQGRWEYAYAFPGIAMQVRTVVEEPNGTLWLGTYSHGVLRVTDPWGKHPAIKRYGVEEGLPSLNHTYTYHLAGGLKAASHAGIYHYRPEADRFEPDPAFAGLFPERPRWVYALAEDPQGRVWMHTADETKGLLASGMAAPEPGGRYRWDDRPVARASGGWVETILPEAHRVIWLGGSEGLVRLDTGIPKRYDPPFPTLVRRVRIGEDRRVIGEPDSHQPLPAVPFSDNQLRMEFALPSFDAESSNRYQVLMEGHDRAWSDWSAEPFRDYMNLAEGHYRFRVRARNLYGQQSSEGLVILAILPPWYRAWWTYTLFVSALAGTIYGVVRWRYRVLERKNRELGALVQERTKHLEKLNAIVASINANLELEDLLDAILRETRVIEGAEKATALVRVGSSDVFRFRAAQGWDLRDLAGVELTLEETEARYTQQALQISEDIYILQNFTQRAAQQKLQSFAFQKAMLVVRIRVHDRVEAYFLFDNDRDTEAFNRQDLELLNGLHAHFVSALQKARMLEDLRAAKEAAEHASAQLREANDRLYELNDEKNRIIGVAAHDLRNPLSGIQLSCEVLHEIAPEDCQPDVQRIQTLGRGMNELIQELLDVNAIEANTAEYPNLDVLNPIEALRTAWRIYLPRAEAKHIQLVLEEQPFLLAWGDMRHLQRVVDNLVSNAVKYSPPGRRVWLRLRQDNAAVRLEIQDEGPGLTPEDQRKAFSAYARLSARPTAGEPSVGLGLSIVKKLVEGMGGTFGVESQPGHGACFWVALPTPPPSPIRQGDTP